MEEIPTREVVTAGMFLVNKHPAIVLFDSGASPSFMSQAFASKYDQKIIEVNKGGYCHRTDQFIRAQIQKQSPKRSNSRT